MRFSCQGGTLGKSTFQGRKRENSMTKAIKEEKGKVPKSNRKAARDKSRKVLQRREQFSFGELRKYERTKA